MTMNVVNTTHISRHGMRRQCIRFYDEQGTERFQHLVGRRRCGASSRGSREKERPTDRPRGRLTHRYSTARKRGGRAPRNSNAVSTTFRSLSSRSVTVLVQSSLGQRHGEERAPRWATTQPRQVYTSRCACSVGGRLGHSSGRKARRPCATGSEREHRYPSQPVPSVFRGVGAVEPRPAA